MITLLKTGNSPEQYDALEKDTRRLIGRLSLRHGKFTVECPDKGHLTVYEAYPEGGSTFTDKERPEHLKKAAEAIQDYLSHYEGKKIEIDGHYTLVA